jgi:hypothetical protein
MRSITTGGPGFVAVGRDDSGGNADAAVWTSPDGRTWTRVADDAPVFGGPGAQWMLGVAAGGPGFIAVGADGAGGPSRWPELAVPDLDPFDPADAAVWVSPDGLDWSRVVEGDLSGVGDQRLRGVAAGGPGIVAVGFSNVDEVMEPAAWLAGSSG